MKRHQDAARLSELLTPSLQDYCPRERASAPDPWQPGSVLLGGIFAGALSAGILAYMNVRCLRLGAAHRREIVAVTLAGLLWSIAIGWAFTLYGDLWIAQVDPRGLLIIDRLIGVIAATMLVRSQRAADRRYHFFGEGGYRRVNTSWLGVVAVAIPALVQIGIVVEAVKIL